ncbi:MAG TPA: lipoprotein insertase outer membrane protein LolB, partial [Methylophilaceae bacterium]|nr:lipoprotein insertase outer membrane protein LolB [Methylophilaceae bacterium]
TNPRGFSGSMQWQHALAGDQIQLFSPLGGQVAQISTTANGVELITSDGKSYQAADAETLTQQTLGWSLPMRGLADWVVGRPASGAVKDASWDTMGRLTTLQQDGWDIEYADYINIDGHQLPTRISLRSPQLNLKLIVENWQLKPESGSTAPTRAGGDS